MAAYGPPHRIPNLDFIPTGGLRHPDPNLGHTQAAATTGGPPHHYDRVILDGPAILGLADCRVLGRIVDSSLLVVRSGSMQLITLHRAKAMLQQSHVAIAGVVFMDFPKHQQLVSYGCEPHSFKMHAHSNSRPRATRIRLRLPRRRLTALFRPTRWCQPQERLVVEPASQDLLGD